MYLIIWLIVGLLACLATMKINTKRKLTKYSFVACTVMSPIGLFLLAFSLAGVAGRAYKGGNKDEDKSGYK